ncbi:cytochrome P450 [Patellaria atrata CBS 101060]|uniref:Cytochrome P450 n=1 Tax=Patellaria atrata CBS 101060 TaxID=1346257 RepID=A0A9P4VKS4_9PEZI|nr:cytochrome P450 [Patellaria atrata CBS 101060]
MFGTSTATVSTVSHDLHRLRRAPLNTFFSKRNVVKMEQSVGKQVKKVVQRLERMRGKIVNLRDLYACFSADVIGDVAFGAGYGLLDKEDFAPGWWRLMMDLSRATHLMKQFPWLYTLFTTLPERLVALVHPLTKQLFDIRNGLSTQIDVFRSTLCHSSQDVPKKDVPKKDVPKKDVEIFPHPTILHHLFSANTPLPPTELTTPRLTDESFTLLGAGTITTSHTLTTALYHILSDPTIESYLRTELVQLSPMPTWTELKRLPYLSAVIAEALRLSFGVSHRLARVSPDEPLYYPPPSEKGEPDTIRPQWVIPPGTPVSMTQMFIHLDPAIFPSPGTFDPSRWLEESPSPALTSSDDDESQSKRQRRIQYMHQHLIPFSRGSRMCAGMHLAYVELYLMLGALFSPGREWRLKLWETDKEDVETVRDFFNPDSGSNSKGVRVLVV